MKPNIEKKILREIDEINRDSKSGVYAYIEGANLQSLKILIIGPEDSPYYGGFFLFKVDFPTDFPFAPPRVNFITPKYKPGCRLHPNLYQEGRVCLSILNTWGGNEWSPALTLEKIFITIQGLLDSNPVTNEPGHERCVKTSPAATSYIRVALYRTLTVAVLDMSHHPDLPETFRQIIRRYFSENRQKYLESLEVLAADDGKNITCFHGTEKIDYQKLKIDLTTTTF